MKRCSRWRPVWKAGLVIELHQADVACSVPGEEHGPRVLRRPLAAELDIDVVMAIYDAVPSVGALRELVPAVTAAPERVRPGVDCWRQWANTYMVAEGVETPPRMTFLTVVDARSWAQRLQSGDHAFDCWAFRAHAPAGQVPDEPIRSPRPEDLVTSPEEGVLTFQQILMELIVNHGTPGEETPAADRLRFVVEMLATQTMRNAMVLVGEGQAYTLSESTLSRHFARAYPHWPLLRGRRAQPAAERWSDVMEAFERIARDVMAP